MLHLFPERRQFAENSTFFQDLIDEFWIPSNTTTTTKMEHFELIQEMHNIEQMPTQERLTLARKRRNQQLKVWLQKEKEHNRKAQNKPQKSNKRSIFFNDSVVLLEAAARNDIDEGKIFLIFK